MFNTMTHGCQSRLKLMLVKDISLECTMTHGCQSRLKLMLVKDISLECTVYRLLKNTQTRELKTMVIQCLLICCMAASV